MCGFVLLPLLPVACYTETSSRIYVCSYYYAIDPLHALILPQGIETWVASASATYKLAYTNSYYTVALVIADKHTFKKILLIVNRPFSTANSSLYNNHNHNNNNSTYL